jgi:Nickel responsive protein SCO4226-like
MPKFMSSHSVPAGAMNREQVDQMAQAASQEKEIHPYRSFVNLSEGKVFCIMEAPHKEALSAWFKKMKMPCDYITPVELEGDRGDVKKA